MILNFLVILLLAVTFYKIKITLPFSALDGECMSVSSCNSYRGFFALVVILHHIAQRTSPPVLLEDFLRVGFLAVSVFFFFSGYGLQKKNISDPQYSHGFLIKRIPTVLIPYTIMSFVYWGEYALLGDFRTIADVWHNFIAYGDPIVWFSWYVVSILVFYFAFYLLMKICRKNNLAMLAGGIIYYALYVWTCRKLGFGIWWYNSAFIPVFGIMWATYEKQIFALCKKIYFIITPILWIIFVLITRNQYTLIERINSPFGELIVNAVMSALFVIALVLTSMKIRPENKILSFLGSISFELYMTQGLVMMGLRNDFIRIENDSLWGVSVVALSIPLAFLFNRLFSLILKKYKILLAKKEQKYENS